MLSIFFLLLASIPFQGGLEQSVGFYSKGSMINADHIELEGDGFVKIFQPRERKYASYDLISILTTIAAQAKAEMPTIERLQIGDIAQQKGGEISDHASHQNGLDVDVVFLRNDRREMPTQTTNGFDEKFVTDDGKNITSNFDTVSNFKLFQIIVNTGRVNRIFMDPLIKKTFCDYAKSGGTLDQNTEVLRRMRSLTNHRDHFHLRISCPVNSPNCVKQDEPPAGDGCAEVESELNSVREESFEGEWNGAPLEHLNERFEKRFEESDAC